MNRKIIIIFSIFLVVYSIATKNIVGFCGWATVLVYLIEEE